MKQSAAKTLGVAALGVAFAAAGAGAANAAPGVPGAPDPSQALGTVSQALPLDNVSQTLPGATGTVDQGQRALGAGLEAAHPAVAEGPAAPVGGLLGGIPVDQTVPAEGLGANGLPLGGSTA